MNQKLKNIGYLWAALATPAVLLTMLYHSGLSRRLADASGIRISPRFSGGEIARTVDHGGYRTIVHRPVFDGLTGDREKGFIQVDWEPVAPLPETLREELDVYGNGEKLSVILNTVSGTAACENDPSWVSGKPKAARYRAGWTMRVGLKKQK